MIERIAAPVSERISLERLANTIAIRRGLRLTGVSEQDFNQEVRRILSLTKSRFYQGKENLNSDRSDVIRLDDKDGSWITYLVNGKLPLAYGGKSTLIASLDPGPLHRYILGYHIDGTEHPQLYHLFAAALTRERYQEDRYVADCVPPPSDTSLGSINRRVCLFIKEMKDTIGGKQPYSPG